MPGRWTRLLYLLVVLFPSSAFAANEWWIVQSTGTVWILEEGKETRLASAGIAFPNAATLATSPNGRALLAHDAESVFVGPSTVLALVQRGGGTRVVQISGVAEFEVERQNVRHFRVETPFLAAVVKGTHFTVRVESASAAVAVDRGTVEVAAFEGGQRADIVAGMEATVTAQNPAISVTGNQVALLHPGWLSPSPTPIGQLPLSSQGAAAAPDDAAPDEETDMPDDADTAIPGSGNSEEPRGGPAGGNSGNVESGSGNDDDNSGHGNDDDRDDDDNSGHGNGDDDDDDDS